MGGLANMDTFKMVKDNKSQYIDEYYENYHSWMEIILTRMCLAQWEDSRQKLIIDGEGVVG